MLTSLNETSKSSRLHLGIFGKTNVGKSSLVNFLCSQEVSITSSIPGTTTDPVAKGAEFHNIGPCMLIDTAGFDDNSELGDKRLNKTEKCAEKTDVALLLFSEQDSLSVEDKKWINLFLTKEIPIIPIITKSDIFSPKQSFIKELSSICNHTPLLFSVFDEAVKEILLNKIKEKLSDDIFSFCLTKTIEKNDCVVLVMPQDKEAPKDRLILPQVQIIRRLLDLRAIVISSIPENLKQVLNNLKNPPKLIITDSQCFKEVHALKPSASLMTSFSIICASDKGDTKYFLESAKAISNLPPQAHILIAESCTHAPIEEDIGRIKIPALLKEKLENPHISFSRGEDFPKNLKEFDLIIHCGGCMFNKAFMKSRVESAKAQNIPMTNYGLVLAFFSNILDEVFIP